MDIESALLTLGQKIQSDSLPSLRHQAQHGMPEWRGADVQVTSSSKAQPSGFMEGNDAMVRTRHSENLTWLFLELRDAFGDAVTFNNKFGFYGALASAAVDHLSAHQPEQSDPRPLLRAVLAKALQHAAEIQRDGKIRPNSSIVSHRQDAQGRSIRDDSELGE